MVPMNAEPKLKYLIVISAVIAVLVSDLSVSSLAIRTAAASAADQSSFGEKKGVATAEDARKALIKYFAHKDVEIGDIAEKELYFEAEIRDRKNTVIDKVIVDKRTGRIRSIY